MSLALYFRGGRSKRPTSSYTTSLLLHLIVLLVYQATRSSALDNSVIFTLCRDIDAYTAPNGQWLLSNDVWNNKDGTGSQCMITNADGTTFQANWVWPQSIGTVHSFPHINFLPPALPISFSNIKKLEVGATWNMYLSSSSSTGVQGLASTKAVCNVALDLFADKDPKAAVSEIDAGYEIMIWFGRFGTAYPLGWDQGKVWSQTIGNNVYDLYVGTDPTGHTTYSWLTGPFVQTFQFDVAPLLNAMIQKNLVEPDVVLGLIEFGSEAFYSPSNVTFSVTNYEVDLETVAGVQSLQPKSTSSHSITTTTLPKPPAISVESSPKTTSNASTQSSRKKNMSPAAQHRIWKEISWIALFTMRWLL